MELTFSQMAALQDGLEALQEQKLPFKLSLILAKNITLLQKEMEFYVEQERAFAQKYLVVNPETGQFVEESPNVFRIKEGMEEECRNARVELNKFTSSVNLRKIPVAMLEDLDFTPKQLADLEIIIDDPEDNIEEE